jgi:putative membrane protein
MTQKPVSSGRTLRDYLVLTIKGFCMGAADVVPGVSGGTMAFILGIYEELVTAIRSFDLGFIKEVCALRIRKALRGVSWQFLSAVATGILLAIFTLARVLMWLLQNRPVLIWSFFFGLILAAALAVGRNLDRWTPYLLFLVSAGAACTYLLVGMVPASTPDAPWFLFMSGAVAICAMILPGISGAFVLVLLGKYHYVLQAVNNRDLFTLFLVTAGAVTGLILFSRLLNWLFWKHHDFAMALLTGLMLESLRKVWPWKKGFGPATEIAAGTATTSQENVLPCCWDGEIGLAISLAVAGFLLVFFLNLLAHREGPQSAKRRL